MTSESSADSIPLAESNVLSININFSHHESLQWSFLINYLTKTSVIEGLDKKKVIMAKARHEDPSIRENALLALQKIMLHNWSAS